MVPTIARKTARADLHYYGAIGFEKSYRTRQFRKGENILASIAEANFDRGIDVCAITSCHPDIVKGSVRDRFGYLFREAKSLSRDYDIEKMGDAVLSVTRGDKVVHIVNSQAVITKEGERRVDHLVIGANDVLNNRPLSEIIRYCRDKGLVQMAPHPFYYLGAGEETLLKYLNEYDAIVEHNSQFIVPSFLKSIPVIGGKTRDLNKKAKNFALKHNKPAIAVSDAHTPRTKGGYIELEEMPDLTDSGKFLGSLREMLRAEAFECHETYENPVIWAGWTWKFFWQGYVNKNRAEKEVD